MNEPIGGVTTSLWMDTRPPTSDQPPPDDCEVVVVGGGIAGVTTAVELARRGYQVCLLDDGPFGGGETARTSAHLASAVDDRYVEIEKMFDRETAKLVAESHGGAIDYIERMVKTRNIDCAFQRVDGYLFDPEGKQSGELTEELAAAQRAGLTCELVPAAPFASIGPALKFANQAEFHPLRYLAGMVEYAKELGVTLCSGVHADFIEQDESKDRPLRVLLRGHGPIHARWVVDATNCDMSSSFAICLQQAPYRSYCIAVDVPRGAIPHALYWETGDNYHYVRVAAGANGREVLIVGGEDHRVGQDETGPQFAALEAWTRKHVTDAGDIVARWSGQIMEPVDGLAHIGASPMIPNVFLCTGDSGNGLTHGTIAGIMIPQLIAGDAAPWAKAYEPSRRHTHAASTYMAEAISSAAPYLDWIRGGDASSVDDIAPGCGALVRQGTQLLACYRDDDGRCHVSSAVCTHLKGIVQWNEAEKSWDCPCHGSRFDAFGTVINGPALANLELVETPLAESKPE